MEEKTYEELKSEALNLGIQFKGNVGKERLAQMIEDFYNNDSAQDAVQESPEETTEEVTPVTQPVSKESKEQKFRRLAMETKLKAMKRRVVTITSNDTRENSLVTVEYLGFENQYFGISRLVPLNIPVELEECLIEVAKKTELLIHMDEVVNGKRTGNKKPVMMKKFNVQE